MTELECHEIEHHEAYPHPHCPLCSIPWPTGLISRVARAMPSRPEGAIPAELELEDGAWLPVVLLPMN